MTRLPRPSDFNDADYPELLDIFRDIDAGIAAIVAADPALRLNTPHKRRRPAGKPAPRTTRRTPSRKAAA